MCVGVFAYLPTYFTLLFLSLFLCLSVFACLVCLGCLFCIWFAASFISLALHCLLKVCTCISSFFLVGAGQTLSANFYCFTWHLQQFNFKFNKINWNCILYSFCCCNCSCLTDTALPSVLLVLLLLAVALLILYMFPVISAKH